MGFMRFVGVAAVALWASVSCAQADDVIVLPAHEGKVAAPFKLEDDSGSLHGKCVSVPKGVGHGKVDATGEILDNGWVDYRFDAKLTTEYELWARVVFTNDDSNSFFVSVDGKGPWILADAEWNRRHWVRLPNTISLAEGAHTMRVRNREDGVKLDEIRLIPVGLDVKALLPLSWEERLPILDKREIARDMLAYHQYMTPIRPPQNTESRASWEKRRAEVRKLVLHDSGLDKLPENLPLDPHIVATLDREGYALSRIYFQMLPGVYGSGWLYVPKGLTGKAPAILNPHGHWQYRAYDPEAQARMIGLVKKGYIALMTDNIHAGDFETGMTPIGLMTLQNIRALDYLCTREDVDTDRLGITGASGGGQQTMYMMAVDDRLKVAAPAVMACYFERIITFDDWHCWCNHAPGVSTDTDMIEMLSVFAPKPALFICSAQDWTSKFPEEEYKEVRKVWGLYGAADGTECTISDEPHGYGRERREAMYRFFNEHMGVEDDGREPEIQTESLETLRAMDRPLDGLRDWARAAAWYRERHKPEARRDEIPQRLAQLIRSVPPSAEVKAEDKGRLEYEGGEAERLLIRGEQGLRLPAFFFPAGEGPAAVVLLPEGKSGAFSSAKTLHPLVHSLLKRGVSVLVLDARLTGELDRNWERNCLAWGRPEAGMAADDARWAARYLATRPEVDEERIRVVGLGRMGVSALLAATLGDFEACAFDAMGGSYATKPLHDAEGYYAGAKWLRELDLPAIPHILRVADLPDIAAACRARVSVLNPGGVYPGIAELRPDDFGSLADFLTGEKR